MTSKNLMSSAMAPTVCQGYTPECQRLWGANWFLQSHTTRAKHAAPVRQIEDSEDNTNQSAESVEVATDLSTKEGLISPANNAAPVCQVKDSEDAAAQKEQVKANKLARRRKKKAMNAKAPTLY